VNEPIEEILRTMGRRPEVPADRARRVEAAVRAQWKATAGRARRRRWLAAGAGLAAAVAGIAVGVRLLRPASGPAPVAASAATVEAVSEVAWSRPGGSSAGAIPVRFGDSLASGSELATSDHGRLALRLGSGHSVRLDGGTQVRVLAAGTIALDRVSIYVDSRGPSGAPAGSLRVRTPGGEIRDVGTQFEARWIDGSLRIRVREGAVALADGGRSIDVGAGTEIVRDPGGAVARRDLSPFGDEWRWAAEIAPMLRLEGRSASEFLAWAARERGLTLRFESRGLEDAARSIRLNGSIERMTLDQALDSVLPTCRMAYRIDHGELIVSTREG
jgi:ferric-dicitrate binding protein FerR (iron transport regulator)